jgi:hypothetical protein
VIELQFLPFVNNIMGNKKIKDFASLQRINFSHQHKSTEKRIQQIRDEEDLESRILQEEIALSTRQTCIQYLPRT